ncbi:MAG: carboxypeptidase-like regulatory domain-containing protein [Acidobacteriota bacterium]|nr:carboxypeptidase-like regulatory domain-containing protein [Blastocatellia bacterium]MDW8238976.1 carboxypeptidase-like regulatory domain-containing protein [Acidobacteriota bacterium]
MKPLLLSVVLLTIASTVSAQTTGSLLGTLRENGTMAPLVGAHIRIMAMAFDHEFATTTDERGRFAYLGLWPGRYLVTITKSNYATIDVFDVVIERSETTRLDLTMTPADRAPFKRQMMRYRRPLVCLDDANIKYVFRAGF